MDKFNKGENEIEQQEHMFINPTCLRGKTCEWMMYLAKEIFLIQAFH